jgi:hypothetical protein
MIITYLLICVFAGIVLSPFIAIGIMAHSRHKVWEMEQCIEHYERRGGDSRATLKRLTELKGSISTMDRQSTERARDLLSNFQATFR